jgi:hypothetical protein
MRLNDVPGDTPRSNQTRAEANTNAARAPRERQTPQSNRSQGRAAQSTGLLALALEKAKQKK